MIICHFRQLTESFEQLGNPTFTSRAAYKGGQGNQPNIPFKQLNLWYNCDTVTIRWESDMKPGIVTGLIVLETVYQNRNFLIKEVFSEFNSGSWLVNLGIFKPSGCKSS